MRGGMVGKSFHQRFRLPDCMREVNTRVRVRHRHELMYGNRQRALSGRKACMNIENWIDILFVQAAVDTQKYHFFSRQLQMQSVPSSYRSVRLASRIRLLWLEYTIYYYICTRTHRAISASHQRTYLQAQVILKLLQTFKLIVLGRV